MRRADPRRPIERSKAVTDYSEGVSTIFRASRRGDGADATTGHLARIATFCRLPKRRTTLGKAGTPITHEILCDSVILNEVGWRRTSPHNALDWKPIRHTCEPSDLVASDLPALDPTNQGPNQ